MSKFTVDLNERKEESARTKTNAPIFENQIARKKPRMFWKVLKIFGALLLVFLIIGAIGGFFYWQKLKKSPQYSLALLIDAARRDDEKSIDELVDTDALVDDFMPQITDKAVELYGRGLPPATIQKMAQVAAPLMPAVKQRARAEVPNLIREKTQAFEGFPFWTIVVGASKYLDITEETNRAFVRSKIADRPLEIVLKKNGERWQVVGIKDEVLARRIAEKIGQDLIVAAQKGSAKKAGEQLGVSNLDDILKRAEGIFK